MKTLKQKLFLTAATLYTVVATAQPNFSNLNSQNITTQVDNDMAEGMKWVSWALWVGVLLVGVGVVWLYQQDSPSKKTGLISFGVTLLLASILTVIFGL